MDTQVLTAAAVSWAPDNRLALALEHVVSEAAPWTLDESNAASQQTDIGALIRERACAGYGFNVTRKMRVMQGRRGAMLTCVRS